MRLIPKFILSRLRQHVALRVGLISAGATLIALLMLAIIFWLILVERLETRIEDSLITRHQISVSNAVTMSSEAVSYTHLTLPTILLV